MKRILSLLLTLSPLSAQNYEAGALYWTRYVYPVGKGLGYNGLSESRLAVTTLGGKHWLEDLPEDLQGRRGICEHVAYREGVTYALGVLNHPVFDRVGNQYFHETQSMRSDGLPLALFRKPPNGAWQHMGFLPGTLSGRQLNAFLPLGGDRFLVRARRPLPLEGPPAWLARIEPDGRGGFRCDPVEGLADVSNAVLRRSHLLRLPGRILVLPKGGEAPMTVLEDRNATLVQRIPLVLPAGTRIQAAAPRPDGRIVLNLVTEDTDARIRDEAHRRLLQVVTRDETPQGKLTKKHLWDERFEGKPFARAADAGIVDQWAVLDPRTGAVTPIASPKAFDVRSKQPGFFVVLPDGNLHFESGRGPFPSERAISMQRMLPPSFRSLFLPREFHR